MNSERPLAGRSVIVTRAREQAGELVGLLIERGAHAIELPAIDIADPPDWGPCDRAIEHLADYDWIVFTSRNAVDRFTARLPGRLGAFAGKIAAVGPATASRLLELGAPPGRVPADGHAARAEGLLDALACEDLADQRVLLPRALVAREILAEGLRARGAEVDVVPVYRLVGSDAWAEEALNRLRARQVDAVCFASGATAEMFFTSLGLSERDETDLVAGVCLASLGPVTSDTLRRLGHPPTVEAGERTMASLVQALVDHFAAFGGTHR